ncbi:MAG: 7-cyano-7-deazaguanine synthase [bacterium]
MAAARRAARSLPIAAHAVIKLDLRGIAASALTGGGDVPAGRSPEEMRAVIPPTYVPARNTVFLSLAVAWAETLRARDVFFGANAVDYSGYPDCRPEYVRAFERAANLGTRAGAEGRPFAIHTPLISMTKAQIITKGLSLGVDFSLTHSCYDPDERGRACGKCDSCLLRLKGFREAGVPDPVPYAV